MSVQKENGIYTLEEKKKAAYALNLCTVSISQIIDYNDINILNQEYENILNNLNLEQMPKDEALLDVLKEILDVITFFRISAGDQKFVDLEYQKRMQNAVWSAIPNVGMLFATSNPIAMGVTLATQVGIGYMNYRRHRAEYQLNRQKEEWQLKRNALDQLNGLRKQLFETSWRLAKEYNFPDQYRLSDDQIHRYNEILAETNSLKRFNKLDAIREDFAAYPPFWYQIGSTANCIYRDPKWGLDTSAKARFKERAIMSFEEYRKLNQFNILRNDILTSSWALEYIDLLDLSSEANRKEGAALVDIAEKYSGKANDVLELCAYAYLKIGDRRNAARIFYYLVNQDYNVPVTAKVLSALYILKSREAGNADNGTTDYKMLERLVGSEYILPMPGPDEDLEKWRPEWENAGILEPPVSVSVPDYSSLETLISSHYKILEDDKTMVAAKEDFLKNYAPKVAEKAIIGMRTDPNVLFTTWGIHFVNSEEGEIGIPYGSIDFSKTTVTRTEKGLPRGTYLRLKGKTAQYYLHVDNPETFLEVLQKASKLPSAASDIITSMQKMPDSVKLAYSKLLVAFCQHCELELIEAIRFANDLKMSPDAFDAFLVHAHGAHGDYEFNTLTAQLKAVAPYPNEESIAYTLLQTMVALIQFSSGRCRGLTVKETNCLDEIAAMMGMSKEMVDSLIPVAQIPYRILKQDISEKEISKLGQGLATVAAAVGAPVAVVLGNGFLYLNLLWFPLFLPGIGTVVTAGALGVAAITSLFSGARKKEAKRMEKARCEQLNEAKKSYLSLYQSTTKFSKLEGLSILVSKAAARADLSIGEYLQSEIRKAAQQAAKQQMNSQNSMLEARLRKDSRCVVKIYTSLVTEQKHLFRTTAKINYAPIHLGDQFALLSDGKMTDKRMNVKQISYSGAEFSEADKVITIFIETDDFTCPELPNTIWVKDEN